MNRFAKRYCELVQKASEIQKFRPNYLSNGDFYIVPFLAGGLANQAVRSIQRMPGMFWVPTQDQLVTILNTINGEIFNVLSMLKLLNDEEDNVKDLLLSPEFSMEEMWLRVVMRNSFDKEWDGQKWILIL